MKLIQASSFRNEYNTCKNVTHNSGGSRGAGDGRPKYIFLKF